MNTALSGYYFISYRRANVDDAVKLEQALHELGIATWRDTTDLPTGQTETNVRAALERDRCLGAVILVTPEVAESDFVRTVEAPLIFERARQHPDFAVAIVAVGLEYSEVDKVLGPAASRTSLAGRNIMRSDVTPLPQDKATQFARNILSQRATRLVAELPTSAALRLDIGTRVRPSAQGDIALALDFTHLFAGKTASAATWSSRIVPALQTVRSALTDALRNPARASAHMPTLELSGQVAIPMAFALGTSFLATSELRDAVWRQPAQGVQEPERWSWSEPPAESHYTVRADPDVVGANDLALLVFAVRADVDAFQRYRARLPALRAVVSVEPPTAQSPGQLNAHTAVDVAKKAVDALKAARKNYGGGPVHVFFAGPVGLAFLIGQQLNTFSTIHTYEYVGDATDGPYTLAATLRPSD